MIRGIDLIFFANMDSLRRVQFGSSVKEPLLDQSSNASAPRRLPYSERIKRSLQAAVGAADSQSKSLAACIRATSPAATCIMQALLFILPLYTFIYRFCYRLYLQAPKNVLKMVFGAALCFFGGTFTASIAAIEAVRQMGGAQVYESLTFVMNEARAIKSASVADDSTDDDADGIADVDQIPTPELAKRKIAVAMKAVSEPARLQHAVAALWAAYIAVLATLRFEFARTTAMAMGFVEVIEYPIVRNVGPAVTKILGADLAHWAETLIDSVIRLVALIVAWYLRMIVTAFYSALRGGRLFADGLCDLIIEKGWSSQVEKLPGVQVTHCPHCPCAGRLHV